MLKYRSFLGKVLLPPTFVLFSLVILVSHAAAQKMPMGLKSQALVPVVKTLQKELAPLFTEEVQPGKCHLLDVTVEVKTSAEKTSTTKVQLSLGDENKFRMKIALGFFDMEMQCGQNDRPWLVSKGGTVYLGKTPVAAGEDGWILRFVDDDSREALDASYTLLNSLVSFAAGDGKPDPSLKIVYDEKADSKVLKTIEIEPALKVTFGKLAYNVPQKGKMFDPPKGKVFEVETEQLQHALSGMYSFGIDKFNIPRLMQPLRWDTSDPDMLLEAKAENGCGALFTCQGKRIMFVEGTPAEMGTAQGQLLKDDAKKLMDRVMYVVGTGDSINSDRWFFDLMEEVERRTKPFTEKSIYEESAALAAAIGVSERNVTLGNLFPERFHCSGVAVRGKASGDGNVYHARVLDYMTETLFQDKAVLQVFCPKGRNKWMSVGYAGFIGSVTAMNEKGLAIGEMGGGGGNNWDGIPFTFMFREIMETCSNVDEALKLVKSKKLTCEYYYVFSDKTGNMIGLKCNAPDKIIELKPGEQNPMLPKVPADTVMMSAGGRAELLSKRLHEQFGKINAENLIEIVKHPVAMKSNLHDAIFCPNTLEIWYADAGDGTMACSEPYAHFKFDELLKAYEDSKSK